jgi:hypothetical protein
VTWDAVVHGAVTEWETLEPGVVTPVSRGHVVVDPSRIGGGRALVPSVWELTGLVHWDDISRGQGLRVKVKALPALPGGVPAVAYTNKTGVLSIDLIGKARNLVAEGGLTGGPVSGSVSAFDLPLPKVQTWAPARIVSAVRFEAKSGASHTVAAAVVSDGGSVRLEGGGRVTAGRYRLAFPLPEGVDRLTRWSARVTRRGDLTLHDTALRPTRSTLTGRVKDLRVFAGKVRRRLQR